MTNNSQPKEIQDKINRIKKEMLDKTNMTENEAYDFAFKCWQCGLDFTKDLEKENQELKDKLNSEALDNWQLHCKYGKYKKAIEILKDKMSLCLFNTKPYEIWLEKKSEEFTQQEYELLNEVLEDEEKD